MHLADHLVLFVRTLRAQGVPVRAGGTLDAARALEYVGIRRRDDVRDALRTVLVSGRDDLARFDRVFDWFWRVWPAAGGSGLPQPIQPPRRGVTTVEWLSSPSVPPPFPSWSWKPSASRGATTWKADPTTSAAALCGSSTSNSG